MAIIGDIKRPRCYCRQCLEVIYVADKPTALPHTAKRLLQKIHEKSGCRGEIEYAAGVRLRGIPLGM